MNNKRVLIKTGKVILATMLSLSPLQSLAQASPILAEEESDPTTYVLDPITLENVGGDNIHYIESLPSAKSFDFSATVTFSNPEEQLSAALIFGSRNGNNNYVNVHKKIDWNRPARGWGYAFP